MDVRGQGRASRLLWADSKATETQRAPHYNQGMQKSQELWDLIMSMWTTISGRFPAARWLFSLWGVTNEDWMNCMLASFVIYWSCCWFKNIIICVCFRMFLGFPPFSSLLHPDSEHGDTWNLNLLSVHLSCLWGETQRHQILSLCCSKSCLCFIHANNDNNDLCCYYVISWT